MMKRCAASSRAVLLACAAAPAALSLACGLVVVDKGAGGSGGAGGGTGGASSGPLPVLTDKVDLVLAIDNSRSMADKQHVLELAVPDLVKSLVNPPCRDASGNVAVVPSGFGPLDACPAGTKREYSPVLDMHVGILSSSLGGHGSDACSTKGADKQSNDDRGHLIDRKGPTSPGEVPTYQGLHFLAWDPTHKLSPPGDALLTTDNPMDAGYPGLLPRLHDMVVGVGEIGCGYEAQLESWYRFLVDPQPPAEIVVGPDGEATPTGLDQALIEERRVFLRPGSALVIVMLTDENDCSIRDVGQYYFVAEQVANNKPFHLPAPRAVCAASPGDACCFSCGQVGPKDADGNPLCPEDPTCKTPDGKTRYLDALSDNVSLRCFEQKRRFGIDFLYPVDRYVQGLTAAAITDREGQVVQNPIFSDLDPTDGDATIRSPDLVFLAGIVGVPWQDIARLSPAGVPDLAAGLDLAGDPVGGFKGPDELSAHLLGKDITGWDVILGDLAAHGEAADPLMREDTEPREGHNPITGAPLAGVDKPLGNPINGNERSIPAKDDLQYACIFPLVKLSPDGTTAPDSRDCSKVGDLVTCDCEDGKPKDNPLCQKSPETGLSTIQVRAKAYPGRRELAVLRGVGSQGVVASVCPAQLDAPAARDFGYRPMVASLLERLKVHLK